jgi:putative transcriptional regulator
MTTTALAGRLLVAAPTLVDPNFARSVVLVLEHNDDGALGVVVNRASAVPVGDVLPDWSDLASEPPVLFQGGPVSLDSALGLGRAEDEDGPIGWRQLRGQLGLVDLDTPTELVADGLGALRIFAGYSGWGSGQLEGEIAEGSWFVVDATPADAFTTRPAGLWRTVLRRQAGELALVSTYPDDPSLN